MYLRRKTVLRLKVKVQDWGLVRKIFYLGFITRSFPALPWIPERCTAIRRAWKVCQGLSWRIHTCSFLWSRFRLHRTSRESRARLCILNFTKKWMTSSTNHRLVSLLEWITTLKTTLIHLERAVRLSKSRERGPRHQERAKMLWAFPKFWTPFQWI